MSRNKTITDQLSARLFWAEQAIKAYRSALESLSPTCDSEGTLLLRQIDKRFPDFKPVTIHDKENPQKKRRGKETYFERLRSEEFKALPAPPKS